MNKEQIIAHTVERIRQEFTGESSGHDWWHIYRVWNNAKHIAAGIPEVDLFIVELGALLHDIADFKFHDGDETVGPRVATEWLKEQGADDKTITAVCHIIECISYKGAGVASKMESLEGKIVQDADRLDAIGAMGIARVFSFSGKMNREMHDPSSEITLHDTAEAYKTSKGTSINHFYEKLLLIKNRMNTDEGKKIAQGRHEYMEKYLEQFYAEWDGAL